MRQHILVAALVASTALISANASAQTVLANLLESGGTGYPSGSNPAYVGVLDQYGNFVFGYYAGTQLTTGSTMNVAVGPLSMQGMTTGSDNTAVGYGALTYAQSVNYATAVGYLALSSVVGTGPGDSNGSVAVGYESQANATGKNNVSMGTHSLIAVTGNRNTAVGTDVAAGSVWGGSDNVVMGHDGMGGVVWEDYQQNNWNVTTNVTGNQNVCIGEACLVGLSSASNNVGAGYKALGSNDTGNDNVAIGYYAGVTDVDQNRNISGGQNVWVGRESGSSTPNQLNNCVAVGYQSKCSQSNQSVIGNNSTTQAIVHGDPHFWNVFVPGYAYGCGSKLDGNPVGNFSGCGYLLLPMPMTVTQISFSFSSGGMGYSHWLPSFTVYDGTNRCSVQWTENGGVAQPTTAAPVGNCTFAAGTKLYIVLNGEYSASLDAQYANIAVTLTP